MTGMLAIEDQKAGDRFLIVWGLKLSAIMRKTEKSLLCRSAW